MVLVFFGVELDILTVYVVKYSTQLTRRSQVWYETEYKGRLAFPDMESLRRSVEHNRGERQVIFIFENVVYDQAGISVLWKKWSYLENVMSM